MIYPPLPLFFDDGLDGLRTAFLVLSAMGAIGYFFVTSKPEMRFRAAIKTTAIGALVLWTSTVFTQLPFDSQPALIVVWAGLLLSAMGDYFLAKPQRSQFLQGLVSFLAGHIAFIVAMLMLTDFSAIPVWKYGVALGMWITVLGVLYFLWQGAGDLKFAITAYAHTIMLMGVAALFSDLYGGWVLVGAIAFIISDTALGVEQFKKPYFGSRYLIWSTYVVAEYLLLFGIVGALIMIPDALPQ